MAYTVIQAGTALQLVDTDGVLTTLTLANDLTLSTSLAPRWAVSGNYVVLVNSASFPVTIDGNGTVRPLTPRAPRTGPVLSAGAAGTLSGTYGGVRYTNVIKDAVGNTIAESDFSPASNTVTITSSQLKVTGVEVSPDVVSARRIYRPTSNGAVLFPWVEIDGNTITQVSDDLSDAGLSIIPAPILGNPPHLTHVAEFRGRLFGASDINIDVVRYTEAGVRYSWPEDNILAIPPAGADEFGVTALIPRREALGVGRRNTLIQVTGSGVEDSGGLPDFDVVILSKELGVESQESVKVYRDAAYFLWKDGVYRWSSEGIECISDGDAQGFGAVRSWFTTNSYFNRDFFTHAFAHIHPDRPFYRLFLASAGSNIVDRWVEYDINARRWWGPHKTDLFSPISAFNRISASNRDIPVVGGATAVYNGQDTRTDGTATAISFDVIGKRHDGGDPDQDKYFGEISLFGKVQSSGSLSVISRAGNLNQTQAITQYYNMTKNRQRLGRLGTGKHAQVELTNAEVGKDVEIYGYEIDPVNLLGRR